MLADKTERDMFPAEAHDQAQQKATIDEIAARGLAIASVIGKQKARGTSAGGMSAQVHALRGRLRPAWQSALQAWIESASAGERTFARPSRRGAERIDLVMPGRKRTSWMLNVILDTSGSMAEDIPLEVLQSKDDKVSVPPLVGALLKNEQDVTLFEKLVFMQRHNR